MPRRITGLRPVVFAYIALILAQKTPKLANIGLLKPLNWTLFGPQNLQIIEKLFIDNRATQISEFCNFDDMKAILGFGICIDSVVDPVI